MMMALFNRVRANGRFMIAPLCIVGAAAFFFFAAPDFVSLQNAANIASQMWVLALLATGQCFAIATRGFDISVGAVAALASAAAAIGFNACGPIGLTAGPAVGLACGAINGVFIGRWGLQPIVATLASLIGARGVALLITSDGQVLPLRDTGLTTWLAFEPVFGLPVSNWCAIALVAAAAWVLKGFVLGRRIIMLGSNPEAVHLLGVDAARTFEVAYRICGLFSGFAGVLITIRAGAGVPTDGSGMELQSIAAAVIGGTALTGGLASIPAVALGAAFIQVLLTGLNLQGVSPFIAQTVVGVVIIGSGLLDFAIRRLLTPTRLQRIWT